MGTVVNRTCPSWNWGSIEITFTVPLRENHERKYFKDVYGNNQLSFPTFLIPENSKLVSFFAKQRQRTEFNLRFVIPVSSFVGIVVWNLGLSIQCNLFQNKKVNSPFVIRMFVSLCLLFLFVCLLFASKAFGQLTAKFGKGWGHTSFLEIKFKLISKIK